MYLLLSNKWFMSMRSGIDMGTWSRSTVWNYREAWRGCWAMLQRFSRWFMGETRLLIVWRIIYQTLESLGMSCRPKLPLSMVPIHPGSYGILFIVLTWKPFLPVFHLEANSARYPDLILNIWRVIRDLDEPSA